MVQKKRSAVTAEEDGPKKRRKDDVYEKPEVKKKSKKSKEYPVEVVEKRLSDDDDDDDYEDDDPEERQEDDNKASVKPETHSTLSKADNYGIGWPQEDLIELFNKIEANIPPNDKSVHSTRIENLDWDAVAFNDYSPAECKAVWMEVHKRIRHFRLLSEIIADARIWVHKPWVSFYKGKAKLPKHPECPRRPLGTFFLYCNAKKSKVTAQYPNLDMPQITSILAQMYHALPKSKKAKYEKIAEDLKKEYDEKLRIFYEQYPEAEREAREARIAARQRSSSNKVPKPPKHNLPPGVSKPITAKMMFINDCCDKVRNEPSYIPSEAKSKAGQLWETLSDKKKLVWIKRAVEEENKFIEKLKLHVSENPEFKVPLIKTVLRKDELELLRRSKGIPQKPASSGYVVYTRVMLQQCPELKDKLPKERMKEISLRWNALPEGEKEEYKKIYKHEKEQYDIDMAAYMESLPEDERREYLLKSQTLTGALKSKKKGDRANNGKIAKTKSKGSVKKVQRQYFPGEPHQPPLKAFDLFVESFVSDTKLSATEAPRFWDMLPANDKAKFQRKLSELKDKYIKEYKKFLKSLNEEEVAKYNELQKQNKKIEASARANEAQRSSADDDSDEGSSSEEEDNDESPANDSDSDEDNETENKKSESSSDSSSSSSESSSDSSSSDDSDSSSDDSDDEDKNTPQAVVKEEDSDSDSSDDD
ncbi:nucleolar transcription factor 1-A-like [Thrips palmi]|uniref:Nucleolar transcription factor 1-A-like n=1 Tax=Thrips palmi TaxID=161013 RepID=A0A6P8ZNM2_THRPL|nr:nucleolar transcription factor 1-A-like [Thrips palmi]XP_034242599.1 nucleolar transcription factor 1-A-like [Thrips palmi]XP_034242600.1 nucleolar transcription factor 1-A-like [Thrips palmi]XP_034242601.1 nucleolar transcription factor 1-A-like [Thrips palmi]